MNQQFSAEDIAAATESLAAQIRNRHPEQALTIVGNLMGTPYKLQKTLP
jgi:hypoxanthine-guanine phosphoribosyltransferase